MKSNYFAYLYGISLKVGPKKHDFLHKNQQLDFSIPRFSEIKVQIKRPSVFCEYNEWKFVKKCQNLTFKSEFFDVKNHPNLFDFFFQNIYEAHDLSRSL